MADPVKPMIPVKGGNEVYTILSPKEGDIVEYGKEFTVNFTAPNRIPSSYTIDMSASPSGYVGDAGTVDYKAVSYDVADPAIPANHKYNRKAKLIYTGPNAVTEDGTPANPPPGCTVTLAILFGTPFKFPQGNSIRVKLIYKA